VTETNVFQLSQPDSFIDPLTEVLRDRAQALLAQAMEAEVATLLSRYAVLWGTLSSAVRSEYCRAEGRAPHQSQHRQSARRRRALSSFNSSPALQSLRHRSFWY
jgi:hypothetical protein